MVEKKPKTLAPIERDVSSLPTQEEVIVTQAEEKAKLAQNNAKRAETLKERKTRPIVPGPGANDIPPTFGGRIVDKFGKCISRPSPRVRASPAYSFPPKLDARETADEAAQAGVGPGLYDPKQETLQKRTRVAFFGSTPRTLGEVRKDVPAPTLVPLPVNEDPRFGHSPRFGFGSVNRTKGGINAKEEGKLTRGCQFPGPGDHDPNPSCTSKCGHGPKFSFGQRGANQSKKSADDEVQAPGPMTYNKEAGEGWTVASTTGCSFAKTPRAINDVKIKVSPGPGDYNRPVNAICKVGEVAIRATTPKWSFGQRTGRSHLDGH